MKRIILYGSLVIFFILALISFRVTKEAVNIQKEEKLNVPETKTRGLQEEGLNAPEVVTRGFHASSEGQAAQSLPLAKNKPAITIIKPPAKENLNSFSENIESKREKQGAGSPSSYSNLSVSEKESGISSEEGQADSGITKLNKQPSEIESKEMNERGIILY